MFRLVKRIFWMLMPVLLWTGCDTLKGPNQPYIAPAVEGRVLDAVSKEPLEDAHVQRYLGKPTRADPFAEKGAQRLMTVPVLNSDAQGRFKISPDRGGNLLFSTPPVYEITLVVRHDTHETLTTNIDLIKMKPVKTNKVWTLFMGDLPLEPKRE